VKGEWCKGFSRIKSGLFCPSCALKNGAEIKSEREVIVISKWNFTIKFDQRLKIGTGYLMGAKPKPEIEFGLVGGLKQWNEVKSPWKSQPRKRVAKVKNCEKVSCLKQIRA
jgi:hypothetical protein